ncbi:MAG: MFS transporter [Deltaproteobacteria bacterium]|nr:MFS transporter [Deltaproteobacteria bacterium]
MTLTLQMEFLSFLPLYLSRSFELSGMGAGMAASAFPAGSLVSLLAGGVVYDRMRDKRPMVFGLLLLLGVGSVLVLRALSIQEVGSSTDLAVAIAAIFVMGFSISPAYYIPMGVFAIEFGRQRAGVLIGIIDTFGYGAFMLVAPMAGELVGQIRDTSGSWEPFLNILAAISLASVVLMTAFLLLEHRWLAKNRSAQDPTA